MSHRIGPLVATSILLALSSQAQNTGTPGVADRHATIDIGAIHEPAAKLGAGGNVSPAPLPGPVKNHGERPGRLGGGGTGGGGGPVLTTNLDLSPPTSESFLGIADNNTTIPPDTHGAVGSNHVMTSLNSEIRYQDRTGGVINTVSLDGFWSPLNNPDAFDPKTVYDPIGGRWIITSMANALATNSVVLLAVSADSSPTGTWYQYSIDADTNDIVWADYPGIGFNKKWIVIHVNMFNFSDSFVRANIYCFDKTNLYAGATNGAFTLFQDVDSFGQEPAETYDPNEETEYFLEEWTISQGELRISTITGAVSAPVYSPGTAFPIDSSTAWAFEPPGRADFAPQLGTTLLIQEGDSRFQNLVVRNGSLWGCHTIFLPTGTPTRASAQWWQVSPGGTVIQRGRIDDTNGLAHFSYPSIAVNARGDALVGCSCFAPRGTPSACYSYRSSNDPPSTLRYPRIMKAGDDAYYKVFSGGKNRWGDYSHTVPDPVDDTAFWTVQEYARPRSGSTFLWGTWWAKVDATSNRAPRIALPGPHVIPVGATTNFSVSVSDPDANPVTLTNTVAPIGATFTTNTFSWTAPASAENTSNTVAFESNDGQGIYNSIATNSTILCVPYDSDGDFVGDAWEFNHFGTLTNAATADPDGDGRNNYTEFVSGTQPTNAGSAFELDVIVSAVSSGRQITVATEPGQRYLVEYANDGPADAATWSPFNNLTNGIGTWIETNATPASYSFIDDEGTNTTGGASGTGRRAYRVRTFDTNAQFTVYLREQTNGIAVDGVVSPAEYGVSALYAAGTNDGFGGFNGIGNFFAAYAGNTLYIGLQGATLDSSGDNGILVFIDSPNLYGGWQNPGLGADQGEVGDSGTPQYAESLLTRANVVFTNYVLLPGEDFADLGFGIVDLAAVESQTVSVARDNMGLYKFALPQHGNNLGFIGSTAVWKDTFSTNGGLEFSVSFTDLGGVTTGDIVKVVAYIASRTGFLSDETLPANLLPSGNPGFGPVTFSNAVILLKIGGSTPP